MEITNKVIKHPKSQMTLVTDNVIKYVDAFNVITFIGDERRFWVVCCTCRRSEKRKERSVETEAVRKQQRYVVTTDAYRMGLLYTKEIRPSWNYQAWNCQDFRHCKISFIISCSVVPYVWNLLLSSVISHPGQLRLLPSMGLEMSTSQGFVAGRKGSYGSLHL